MGATTSVDMTSETAKNSTPMGAPMLPVIHQSSFKTRKPNVKVGNFLDPPDTAQETNDHAMIVIIAIFTAAILLFSIW